MVDLSLKYKNFPKMPKTVEAFLPDADIEKFLKRRALEVLAESEAMLDRGQDVEGRRMKRYSSDYRKTLIKSGESGKTDLLRTGELRNSRYVKALDLKVEIRFSPARSGKRPSNTLKVSRRNAKRIQRAGRPRKEQPGLTSRAVRSRRGGTSQEISNIELARELMKMGYVNWHAISVKMQQRITTRFSQLTQKKFIDYLKRKSINSN